MHIERLQVESDGFLGGLDVHFAPGLNVIIGARGTGKTSILELIRFCLGAGAFTQDAGARGNQQAIAILSGGSVSVTVNDQGLSQTVTRSSSGHLIQSALLSGTCTVLAQNEVEAVGAQAPGRLYLIDRFRLDRQESKASIDTLRSQIRSLTVELQYVLSDAAELRDQLAALSALPSELEAARAEQERLLDDSRASESDRNRLLALQQASQSIAAQESEIALAQERISGLAAQLRRLISEVPLPDEDGEVADLLRAARQHMSEVRSLLSAALARSDAARDETGRALLHNAMRKEQVDDESRRLRQALEQVQAGLGAMARRVAELEERHGQLTALREALAAREMRYQQIADQRISLYRDLENWRDYAFSGRAAVAESLNKELGPTLRVRVSRSGGTDEYQSAIVAALRGSGLHYNTLAPMIAGSVSPYELTIWAETGEATQLANAVGIATDRAAAVLGALRNSGLGDIVSSEIEDSVALDLLDGREYKSSERLSIGQRCTVVLPILLGQHGDPLLVDQPEDHLDNAFIASTLVRALRTRREGDQFIFSSHNANIPVLGEADSVVVMDSDGDRGFVRHSGSLGSPKTVDAITRLLEGGAEAFARRAKFYGTPPGKA